MNRSDATIQAASHTIAGELDAFEIDETELDAVLGGRAKLGSSKVIDLQKGWTGTDADF